MGVVVRQKTKGKGQPWWIFIAHQGKRKSVKVGNQRAAEKMAGAIRVELAKATLNMDPPKPRAPVPEFGEYAEKWFTYIESMRRESTAERYRQLLDSYVKPAFKGKRLDEITRGDVRDFLVGRIQGGFSRSSIGALRDVVSGVFNFAVDEEIVKASPTAGITKRLEIKREKKQIDPLTADELGAFLLAVNKVSPDFSALFIVAAKTGMRLGEVLALQWGDVDFNSSFIWVRRSRRRGRITSPKNHKARRIDMSGHVALTLKQLLTKEKTRALKEGKGGEIRETIFHDGHGRPLEQNRVRRIFKRVLSKAGLREIRFHDLRHSFASLLLSQGESPVYVKEQLGHSSIQITVDIYGHWIQGKKEAGVNRLDSLTPACTYPHPDKVSHA
ncbi:MAG: site-specific integrase [Deltaproteobacteria bacterium]|nr:site-specific integrase [Deltaproteobacteria bacterium]